MKKYILALDQGTTSSRAILLDRQARPVAQVQYDFPQIFPKPGWVEHDPDDLVSSQFRAMADCVQKAGVSPDEIAAIGITNQRETTLVWDRESGKPIGNAIVWQCRRTAPLCEDLIRAGHRAFIRDRTGLVIDAYFAGTKIRWILDTYNLHEEAATGRLAFGTVDSWLVWNLTGGTMHVTDVTNASRTLLMNIRTRTWDEELCRLLQVPMDLLPEIRPSSGRFGAVAEGVPGLEAFAGIPITGIAGDQHAALFGQGCLERGSAKNTYGTGCFLLMNTGDQPVFSEHELLTTVAWETGSGVRYALEGSVFNAGSAIQWLRDELGLIQSAPEINDLAGSVPDSGGVYFVSAFTGLGAPYWDMYARGTLVGVTRGTGKGHLARAVLDGIAYQVAALIEAMEADSGMPVDELRVDGGASASDLLMQFQADLLGRTVDRPENRETTALGAAFLAGLGSGFWQDEQELAGLRRTERRFVPGMDQDERQKKKRSWSRAVERARTWVDPDEPDA